MEFVGGYEDSWVEFLLLAFVILVTERDLGIEISVRL